MLEGFRPRKVSRPAARSTKRLDFASESLSSSPRSPSTGKAAKEAASMEAAPSSPSSSSSSLPWTWIFEHLIGQKEIGTPILREMMLTVPHTAITVRVRRKLALRYLEEAISAEKLDASLIVLIENLLEHSQRTGILSFPTSLDYSHLLFRVKLETVLMHIRTNPRRWHIFSKALDLQFPDDSKDAQYREKRKQLLSLSKLDDDEKIMELLEEFPVSTLRCDILKCLTSEKCRLEEAFLDKLLWDVHTGKCPVAVGLSIREKNESEEDFHSADITGNSIQSGEQTDMDAVETRHDESFAMELEKSRPKHIVKASAERSGSEGQGKHCHKCKKGGILVCCEGCPIAVHQICLEPHANIVSGEWFCPLCIERKAAEVLAKAKEEEIAAKEKAARFLAEMEASHIAEKTVFDGNADDHGIEIHEMNTKRTLRMRKAVGQMKASLAASAAAVCSCTDIPEESRSPNKEFHETAGESSLKKKSRDDVACGAILDDVGGTSSKDVHELQSAVQATEPQGVDGDGHDGDIEEDNQDRGRRNRNVNRKQKLKMRGNRLIPGLRRKRLPWSKEEEDALKEGVKKFSHDGTWGFQWTRILDYGRGKFHPSRTDIDLKDKWRNLKDKSME